MSEPIQPEESPAPLLPSLEERLQALEGQVKQWKRLALAGGAALVLLTVLVGGTFLSVRRLSSPEYVAGTLQAQRIVLLDAAGQKRAELATGADADLSFTLLDPSEQKRIHFSVLPDGTSGIAFFDLAGRTRMGMGVLPDQTVDLAYADEQGTAYTLLERRPPAAPVGVSDAAAAPALVEEPAASTLLPADSAAGAPGAPRQ